MKQFSSVIWHIFKRIKSKEKSFWMILFGSCNASEKCMNAQYTVTRMLWNYKFKPLKFIKIQPTKNTRDFLVNIRFYIAQYVHCFSWLTITFSWHVDELSYQSWRRFSRSLCHHFWYDHLCIWTFYFSYFGFQSIDCWYINLLCWRSVANFMRHY